MEGLSSSSSSFVYSMPYMSSSLRRLPSSPSPSSSSSSTRRAGVCRAELAYQLDDGFGPFILPLPPGPVQFPRKNLNRKFAVLLMRSAYDAADDLDFIPMNEFQVKFWKLRQSEVEPYTLQHRPLKVKYGDLTDPLYFDFISFAQFATISNEMRTGAKVFQEKLGAGGESRTVRRNASILDNSLLPLAFTKRAGTLIYQRLLEGFESENFDAPNPCSTSDLTCIKEGINHLLQVFVKQGYCLNANVEVLEPTNYSKSLQLRVRVQGGATLWGMQALASRGASILTDFDALAINSFIEASLRNASYKIHLTDTYKEEIWTII